MAKGFSQKEKLKHYTAVAKGTCPTKQNSKFSASVQRSYATGQRDARNEANAIFKYKHSSAAERAAYKRKRAERNAAYKSRGAVKRVRRKK